MTGSTENNNLLKAVGVNTLIWQIHILGFWRHCNDLLLEVYLVSSLALIKLLFILEQVFVKMV